MIWGEAWMFPAPAQALSNLSQVIDLLGSNGENIGNQMLKTFANNILSVFELDFELA